jgi:hypothetical protein
MGPPALAPGVMLHPSSSPPPPPLCGVLVAVRTGIDVFFGVGVGKCAHVPLTHSRPPGQSALVVQVSTEQFPFRQILPDGQSGSVTHGTAGVAVGVGKCAHVPLTHSRPPGQSALVVQVLTEQFPFRQILPDGQSGSVTHGTAVAVCVDVEVCVGVEVKVWVAVGVKVRVGVNVNVWVAVGVRVRVGVDVKVRVGVAVTLGVAVGDGGDVCVTVAVGVGVGDGVANETVM